MVVRTDAGIGLYEKVFDESSSCGSSSSNENSVKHNYLERKRRIHLKQSFDRLREKLTAVKAGDKAPKVVILSAAIKEIKSLVARERELIREKYELTIAQTELKNRLQKQARWYILFV